MEIALLGIHVTPGVFSTDFLSVDSYTTPGDIIDDYENTVVGRWEKLSLSCTAINRWPKKLKHVIVD